MSLLMLAPPLIPNVKPWEKETEQINSIHANEISFVFIKMILMQCKIFDIYVNNQNYNCNLLLTQLILHFDLVFDAHPLPAKAYLCGLNKF